MAWEVREDGTYKVLFVLLVIGCDADEENCCWREVRRMDRVSKDCWGTWGGKTLELMVGIKSVRFGLPNGQKLVTKVLSDSKDVSDPD